MKSTIYLVFLVFFNCSNKSNIEQKNIIIPQYVNDSVVFMNSYYKMTLYKENKIIKKVSLINLKNNINLKGDVELILIDGEIPEGTNRIDYDNPNDYRGYECDSTYQFVTDEIKLSFAIEKISKRRLDLSIYDSNNRSFNIGDFTLKNQNIK